MLSREIDELVAIHVFGGRLMAGADSWVFFPPTRGASRVKPYSTDIAAAWTVVEKMEKERGGFALFANRYGSIYSGGEWSAYFGLNAEGAISGAWAGDSECRDYWDNPVPGHAAADTPATAICLAALKALGVTPPESERGEL